MGPISKGTIDAMAMMFASADLVNQAVNRPLEIFTAQATQIPWSQFDARDHMIGSYQNQVAELTADRDKWRRLALFLLNQALKESGENPFKS